LGTSSYQRASRPPRRIAHDAGNPPEKGSQTHLELEHCAHCIALPIEIRSFLNKFSPGAFIAKLWRVPMSRKLNAHRETAVSLRPCAAIVLLSFALLLGLAVAAAIASKARAADPEAATVIADQIRRQGIPCEQPVKAERDATLSAPHNAVWTLQCKDAVYRVRLVPNSAAKVELLKK
jgi:hypothetical protein